VLGAATTLTLLALTGRGGGILSGSCVILVMASVIKLAFERRIFLQLVDEETPQQTPLNKTARLLAGELNGAFRVRVACGLLGGVLLPLTVWLQGSASVALAVLVLGLVLVGELLERYLFFTAVATQKMPGGFDA
jgi:formate dehydrogenase iron-sulfur subunit